LSQVIKKVEAWHSTADLADDLIETCDQTGAAATPRATQNPGLTKGVSGSARPIFLHTDGAACGTAGVSGHRLEHVGLGTAAVISDCDIKVDSPEWSTRSLSFNVLLSVWSYTTYGE
jgi:hypothetical protein